MSACQMKPVFYVSVIILTLFCNICQLWYKNLKILALSRSVCGYLSYGTYALFEMILVCTGFESQRGWGEGDDVSRRCAWDFQVLSSVCSHVLKMLLIQSFSLELFLITCILSLFLCFVILMADLNLNLRAFLTLECGSRNIAHKQAA